MSRMKEELIKKTVEEADERKVQLEQEIAELKASIKAKKAELKDIAANRAEIEAAEAQAKAEAAAFTLLQKLTVTGTTLL